MVNAPEHTYYHQITKFQKDNTMVNAPEQTSRGFSNPYHRIRKFHLTLLIAGPAHAADHSDPP